MVILLEKKNYYLRISSIGSIKATMDFFVKAEPKEILNATEFKNKLMKVVKEDAELKKMAVADYVPEVEECKCTFFYSCLAFSLKFWPKIKQFPSNCSASDWAISFKTANFH